MTLDMQFEEREQSFSADFGQIQDISDGGYERGYAEGEADGYEKGHTEGLEEGLEQGFEAGMISNGVYYADSIGFGGIVFPENYDFVMRLQKARNVNFLRSTNLKSVKLIADNTDTVVSLQQVLRECTTVETLDLTEYSRKISSLAYAFLGTSNIKSIYGALDLSECTEVTIWLNSAIKVEDIEFVPGTIKISISFSWCPLLTDATIQSITDGLADLTGQTAQTLTLHATVGAKLTDEQKASITAKNWTLVY